MKCAFRRVTTVSVRLLPSEINIQISQEMPIKNPPTPTQRTQSRTGKAAQKNQLGLQIHAAVDPNVMKPASLKLIRMGQPSLVRSSLSPDCAARMRWYMPTARKMRLRAISTERTTGGMGQL